VFVSVYGTSAAHAHEMTSERNACNEMTNCQRNDQCGSLPYGCVLVQ